MPGNVHLKDVPGIVMSWTLEKDLLPEFCWTSINPWCILKHTVTFTDKCSYDTTSKKLLLTASGNHYQNTQLGTMWKSTDHRVSCPNGYVHIMPSVYMAQETEQKTGWKNCKHQNTRKSSVKHLFLWMTEQIRPNNDNNNG